jgi:hypothetical protein
MSEIRGRFLWYEAMTKDVDAALRFYTAVFGWGTQRWDGMDQPYHMFTRGDRPLAGVMQIPPEGAAMPAHWLGYIGTDDVAATTAEAERLGATIHVRNMVIPTVGTMSVFQDPQGVMVAAYTPEHPMPVPPPQPGDVDWHEIATTDIEASFRFYSALFGWEKMEAHDMGPLGLYQEYGAGGRALGGIYVKPADMPAPPHVMYYVRVTDLDDAVARVRANGGQIVQDPCEVPGGDKVAVCLDSQGAAFALHWKRG